MRKFLLFSLLLVSTISFGQYRERRGKSYFSDTLKIKKVNIIQPSGYSTNINGSVSTNDFVTKGHLDSLTAKVFVSFTKSGDSIILVLKDGTRVALIDSSNTWDNLSGKPSTFTATSHSHAQSDITNLSTDLSGKQSTLISGTNIKSINSTTLLGSGNIDITTVSGNAGTATTLATPRLIDGVSFNGSADISADNTLLAYQALGSPILAETVGQKLAYSNVSTNLVDGQIKFTAVYLPKAATLTGVKFYVRTLGVYTGDNNNRIGLYSYSGGNLTLVASSANSATLWTSAANAVQTIPFSSTYAAAAGIYFVAFLYNNSAQTTAPALASAVALNNLAMASTALGFTNSAKLTGTANGTDLTTPIAMSAITASVITSWASLY